uniref:Genome assembly, chromosome: II n=1 Tax=Caenorhabditis tropicalis TaxID=1561998 RepID=A0A1I7TR58_9PELO
MSSSASNDVDMNSNNLALDNKNPGIFPPTLQPFFQFPSPVQATEAPPVLESMAPGPQRHPKKRGRARKALPVAAPKRRAPTPDVLICSGPLKERKLDPALEEQLNQIKSEPADDYGTVVRQEAAAPEQSAAPPQNVPRPVALPQIVSPEAQRLGLLADTKNYKIYEILKREFPKWRFEITEGEMLEFQKNCIIKRHITQIINGPFLPMELANSLKTQKMFLKAMTNLNERQQKALVSSMLSNSTNWTQLFMAECGRHDLMYYIHTLHRLISNPYLTPRLKYIEVNLPTRQEMGDTILEAFHKVDMSDLNPYSIACIRTYFLGDWSDPWNSIHCVFHICNIIHVMPTRVMQILEEARANLRTLVNDRNYYWSIDHELPSFN